MKLTRRLVGECRERVAPGNRAVDHGGSIGLILVVAGLLVKSSAAFTAGVAIVAATLVTVGMFVIGGAVTGVPRASSARLNLPSGGRRITERRTAEGGWLWPDPAPVRRRPQDRLSWLFCSLRAKQDQRAARLRV